MTARWLAGAAFAAITVSAAAHEGALDSYGCHPNVSHGSYHCHEGFLAGRAYASKNKMLEAHQEREQEERVRARAANPPPGEALPPAAAPP